MVQEEAYIRGQIEEQNRFLKKQCELLANRAIPGKFGEPSDTTGLPRDIIVGSYSKSDRRAHRPQYEEFVQLYLPLYAVRCIPQRP